MLYFLEMKQLVSSETAMKDFGARLGAVLKGGECIELIGDIGAGKTTFTKGLAAGMGISETVQSPTFTISRLYEAPKSLRLAHYDFYRLADAGIMADELTEAVDDSKTVIVIEWGEVVRRVVPNDHMEIRFVTISDDERELSLTAYGSASQRIINGLAK